MPDPVAGPAAGGAAPPPRSGSGQITRADVARYAGVSSAVVSYVVNNGPRPVSPATAARVLEAVRVLGYRPNASARALRTGSTKLLGLVVPAIGNLLFAEMALGIESAAADRGYAVLLTSTGGDPDVERRHVLNLTARQIDGLLLTTGMSRPDLASLPLAGVPTVLLGAFEQVPGFVSVGVDAFGAAYDGTNHLVGHGHRSIALVIGRGGAAGDELRERGWLQATRDAGLSDGAIAREAWSRAGGYAAGRRLFGGTSFPSAVFVSSDIQAVGVLRALHELGRRVPQDVAIVSFDGTEDSLYSSPPLTVVRQPVQAMAADAVERVLLPVGDDGREHVVHRAELIKRESCGCHPGDAPSRDSFPA
jgi:LacI family transcriptional regulator